LPRPSRSSPGCARDGFIEVGEGQGVYPQLLAFYEVNTEAEQVLYDMFMDHRMKTFQGAFHINPDYTTWYGYAKMKQDLAKIREIASKLRAADAS
jgi:hydroxylamine dehydrogenase